MATVNNIEIIDYSGKYHDDFRRLNLGWLEEYQLTESHDLAILNDPENTVINKGGCIFLALHQHRIIGTAGLAKESDTVFELIKMAVDPAYRGRGISKLLLNRCIGEAKNRKAKKLFLFSNSRLQTAISLYTKYGFRHTDPANSPLLTADIKMELVL